MKKNKTQQHFYLISVILLTFMLSLSCKKNLLETTDQKRFDGSTSNPADSLVFRPTILSIVPTTSSNNNNPSLSGTSKANVIVEFYTDSGCVTSTGITTETDATGLFQRVVPVLDDTITAFYAKASSPDLGSSECSTAPLTYTEDSTAPPTPIISSSSPLSPSDSTTPTISGTGEANAPIKLYSNVSCSTQIASGTIDGSGNYSIGITVSTGSVNALNIYAKSTDIAGNSSACSGTTLNYESYTIPAGVAWLSASTATAGNINVASIASFNWDYSRLDSSYYTHSTASNSHQLTITQQGDYLIAYTIPMLGTSGQRTALLSEVTVNGSPVTIGVSASSYIRTADGHSESSNHGSFVLDNLNANDIIELTYIATTTITNTVNLSGQASFYIEYLSPSRIIFKGVATQVVAGTNLNQGTASPMQWTEVMKNGFTHDDVTNSHEIQVNSTGSYLLSLDIPISGAFDRGNLRVLTRVDGVTVDGGEAAQGYVRNISGHNEGSLHWSGLIPNINSGSKITIEIIREAQAGTLTILSGKKASIYIEKVDTSSNFLSLRATELTGGTDWNPATKDTIKWSTQDSFTDSSIYTHSTSSNPHAITITKPGDYFLMYNDVLTSTIQRAAPVINVEINSNPVLGAQTKTHYTRSSGNHNTTSASLVFFLKDVKAGDILTVTAQQEALIGTTTSAADALLMLWKKE